MNGPGNRYVRDGPTCDGTIASPANAGVADVLGLNDADYRIAAGAIVKA